MKRFYTVAIIIASILALNNVSATPRSKSVSAATKISAYKDCHRGESDLAASPEQGSRSSLESPSIRKATPRGKQ